MNQSLRKVGKRGLDLNLIVSQREDTKEVSVSITFILQLPVFTVGYIHCIIPGYRPQDDGELDPMDPASYSEVPR